MASGCAPCVAMSSLTQRFLSDFSQCFAEKLKHLGNAAADAKRYGDAISYYTTALSLSPPSPQDILIKRGEAFIAAGSWEKAVDDALQVHRFSPDVGQSHRRAVVR